MYLFYITALTGLFTKRVDQNIVSTVFFAYFIVHVFHSHNLLPMAFVARVKNDQKEVVIGS